MALGEDATFEKWHYVHTEVEDKNKGQMRV